MKYGKFNIDIVIETDTGKHLIEVNGLYWHGLIKLDPKDKYYSVM